MFSQAINMSGAIPLFNEVCTGSPVICKGEQISKINYSTAACMYGNAA